MIDSFELILQIVYMKDKANVEIEFLNFMFQNFVICVIDVILNIIKILILITSDWLAREMFEIFRLIFIVLTELLIYEWTTDLWYFVTND